MHPQLTGRAALVATVFLQHRKDEPLLEFPNRLGVQNIAFVHLQDECFELISHGILFLWKSARRAFPFARFRFYAAPKRLTYVAVRGAADRVLDKSEPAIPRAQPKWRRARQPGNTAPAPNLPATSR